MMFDDEYETRIDNLMESFREKVDECGWAALGVCPTCEGEPHFTYTIGLNETLHHPELIIYGMGAQQAHSVLHSAIEMIKEKELVLTPGEKYEGIVQGYEILIRSVDDPDSKPLNMATRFYGQPPIAVQLVWPDEAGIFPGDEGCIESVVRNQEPWPE